MPAYGRPQIRSDSGDHMSMIDFGKLGVSRWHQDGSGSGRQRRLNVAANIADQQAVSRSKAEFSGGRGHHSRLGFPATAAGVGSVRANLPSVEGAQQRLHSGIDPSKLIGIDQATGDARLVAHYPDSDALASQLVEGAPRSGQRLDSPWVGKIGHVFDQGSISIEEHGPRLAGRSLVSALSGKPNPKLSVQSMGNCERRDQPAGHHHGADLWYGPWPGENAASGELSSHSQPHQACRRRNESRNAP